MIFIKSFFYKNTAKINIKHLMLSYFIILILLLVINILRANFEFTMNTSANKVFIISNLELENQEIKEDIENNDKIVKYENIENDKFSIEINDINNLELVNKYFSEKNYSIYIDSIKYDKNILILTNFFLILSKILIIIIFMLLLKILNDIYKEELGSDKLLFTLGFSVNKIGILLFIKITLANFLSFFASLILFLPIFMIIINKIWFMKFIYILNIIYLFGIIFLVTIIILFIKIRLQRLLYF